MVRQIVDSYIHPTDVKIYYENNVPYMEYRGITKDFNNDTCEVYLRKIPLTISTITYTDNLYEPNEVEITFIGLEDKFSGIYRPEFKTIEKNMTKAQIEKELGYKINIIDK